jgi:hypothetical protein
MNSIVKWRMVVVPTVVRHDHEVTSSKRAHLVAGRVTNRQSTLAVEDVQQLIVTVAFPRRPPMKLAMPHVHP